MATSKTTKKILLLALIALIAVLSVVFVLRGRTPAPQKKTPKSSVHERMMGRRPPKKPGHRHTGHAKGIDRAHGPALAAMRAPKGKTPCESAYNAFKAFSDTPDPKKMRRHFGKVPERDVFLKRCAILPEQTKLCLHPKYVVDNPEKRMECLQLLSPVVNSTKLFDTLPDNPLIPDSDPVTTQP